MRRIALGIVGLAAVHLIGCSVTPVATIQERTILLAPPVIEDTLAAKPLPMDTGYEAERIRGRDTIILVRFFPREKKVYVRAVPETLKYTYKDTISVIRQQVVIEELVWWKQLLLVMAGVGVGCLLMILGWRR
jgi:hypothetical protein